MQFKNRIAEADQLKADINAKRPFSAHAVKELKAYYRVGLTWTSNALEGNSLTETETKVVLEDGVTIGGKPLKDHLEAVGHAEAFDFLYTLAKRLEIKEKNILDLHRLFYTRIDPGNAGRYRKVGVLLTGSKLKLPKPKEIKSLMKSFLEDATERRSGLHPIEFASLLHLGIAKIHPFIDGNGRTARLLMNLALLQSGYPITIIPPVVRAEYIAALRDGDKGDDQPFINLISNMVVEGQRNLLRLLENLTEK